MNYLYYTYEDFTCFSCISIDIVLILKLFIENQDTASDTDDELMVKLLEVKERRAIAEIRKADAIQRIAVAFKKKIWYLIDLNTKL